ncbi:hypothetical protein ACI8B_180012 [Acinetobacter proteolyticus]|uniref:Uncharacterized protein n=1 Tax=Acinetobacter proteolyticus TaxID=1776741 RepID=A0A653K2T3_9GAMM|nr:hypothetical protein ACI8B_180012 [Acinetobacter proteolyticus]
MLNAKEYYRDAKTKQVIKTYKNGSWFSGKLMCAEKTGGFNLVNYRHSSGVYHEQETEDLHRRI